MVGANVKMAIIGMMIAGVIIVSTFPIFLILMTGSKLSLSEGEPVSTEHVDWIVQELATSDIRANHMTSQRLEMEVLVTPDDTYFTVVVDVRTPTTKQGRANDPDVRLTVGRDVVMRLLDATDFFSEVKKLRDEGSISVEMLKPYDELVRKGYTDIYDQIVK
jgi:hypothetical protein